ncbi:MAG: Cof-type HAD-IIB family hydrolase [Ruminococcus sp.]|nr:Cof-type HAD-IIB family hydrolase [Ruminococcus sp.]
MFDDISKVLLLSDMDGTLLNSRKQISDTDRAAIEKFMALGGKFTVATGRTIQSFQSYLAKLDLKMPVIMYNGAALYDYGRGELLFTMPLPSEARTITREILTAMPQVGGEVLKADGTYVFRNNDYEALHTKLCGVEPYYTELDSVPEGGWLKVLFAMAPEDIPQIEIIVRQKGYSSVSFVKTSDIFYEMLPLGVTKGSALAEYRRFSGMEGFTFVSVGDFDNDIEMLREADLGAAPANAEDSVKETADIVLNNSCETGAVAELIDYIIERCK